MDERFEFETARARKITVETVLLGLRLSTVGRTRVGAEQVRTLESNSSMALGATARHNQVVHQATHQLESTLLDVPCNNTARQAIFLDSQRAAMETSTPKNEDRQARKIKMKINGS